MRTKVLRFSVVVAVMAPLVMMGVSAAPAAAEEEGTTCSGNTAEVMLSPGLTETAKVQNISLKGTLSGCVGGGVTGGKYVAHMKTESAVTCAALKGAGEPVTETSIVIKWSPKGHGNSHGTFSMPLTETGSVSLGGTLAGGGPFEGKSFSGTVSQTFTGGATCGVSHGKKKAKAVKKGSLTGSLTIS